MAKTNRTATASTGHNCRGSHFGLPQCPVCEVLEDQAEATIVAGWNKPARKSRLSAKLAADAVDALRAFCGDHEASGHYCEGLNAAYFHAMAVLAKIDGAK